jgi:hypothetical protein
MSRIDEYHVDGDCACSRPSKFSTATIDGKGTLVPWLSAHGPLSYSPENPPDRGDYFFQYSWVIPGIFAEKTNLRQHYYFGAVRRDEARELFEFWQDARAKRISRVADCPGIAGDKSVNAPSAVYFIGSSRREPKYLFIQHGSYQFAPLADQPFMKNGDVVLYRGIQKASVHRFLEIHVDGLSRHKTDLWKKYIAAQSFILSDSVRSFTSIHDRAKRVETCHIRDDSWISDEIAWQHGLDLENDVNAKRLWHTTHRSYSLARHIAEYKFGPNYVLYRTPLSNIRLTTFFAREHEVRIIRPDRVVFLQAFGCNVEQKPW